MQVPLARAHALLVPSSIVSKIRYNIRVSTCIAGHNFCRFMQRFSQHPPKRQPTDNLVSLIEPAWRHRHCHRVESLHKYARHFMNKILRNMHTSIARIADTLTFSLCKERYSLEYAINKFHMPKFTSYVIFMFIVIDFKAKLLLCCDCGRGI